MEKKNEKGVTLVETVVALALIVLITSSVFFTINFTMKSQRENEIKSFFINETESVAMCYYSNDFEKALSFLTGSEVEIDSEAVSYSVYYNEKFEYTDEANATYKVEINYETEDIDVLASNVKTGKQIYRHGGSDEK